MVTRKPVPSQGASNLAPSASPPYPVTPVSATAPKPFSMQDAQGELRPPLDSDAGSSNVWSHEETEAPYVNPLGTHPPKPLPESLRVGPHPLSNSQHSSQEPLRPDATSTNPFLRRQATGETSSSRGSSTNVWEESMERPAPPSAAPPPPPVPHGTPPHQEFANLSVSDSNTNPWQPALEQKAPSQPPPPVPQMSREDSGNQAWANSPQPTQAEAVSLTKPSQQPVLVDVEEPESPAWDEEGFEDESPQPHELPAQSTQEPLEDGNVWGDNQGQSQQNNASKGKFVGVGDTMQSGEGWNLIDHETVASGAQQSGTVAADGREVYEMEREAPPLPPRNSTEESPPQPPRPAINTTSPSSTSVLSPGATAARTQKKETYEIKKITWHDVTAASNPRISPILVQNANGPCPLLALVNALTLSTPANVETALVETLRSREQVSLGLLLDAVIDELMSDRRGGTVQELPDVTDLYSFLMALHTGMNVNPRFIPTAASSSPNDLRKSMSHVHPSDREGSMSGTFEDTREMKLYSTFSLPLIHGWLPERDSPAYTSLARSAKSYEDAQNLMFREEELEDKIVQEGLSFEEQSTLEDILTIKAFLHNNATQLTPFGLETITASLAPGAVAILFRNDHFSTLYRHPDTLQLLQLVTDMGYAGHEEVVWESLIDVTGENAEFFSGDFRLVGGAPATPMESNTHESGAGWTTVTGRGSNARNQNQTQHLSTPSGSSNYHEPQTPQSPNTEQEDHDLALALQLQEEEEQRHREEQARRRRETELSHQYIEQQGSQNNNVAVHTRGGRGGSNARGGMRNPSGPSIPPRRPPPATDGAEPPPPTYEQAAQQT
ncbi:Ubiquitin carboxyl-terminal hydrolase MIY1, partial [Lachnellula suecica]